MPPVQAKLSMGGKFYKFFNGLEQRSLLIRGTAAIKRVETSEVVTDKLTINGITINPNNNARTVDSTPISGSTNLVESGGVHSLVQQAKANVVAADFIQFTNVVDILVNNGGGSTDSPQDGIPEDSDFRRFPGFATGFTYINTNQLVYTLSNDRVTINVPGYYRVTAHMNFFSQVQRTAVAVCVGKNGTLTGPIGMHGYIRAANPATSLGVCKASSVTTSHIVSCQSGDEIGIFTARHGISGQVQTPATYSTFLVERLSDVRPQVTATTVRTGAGNYTITFASPISTANYTLLLANEVSSAQFISTPNATDASPMDDYQIAYADKTQTGFKVYIRNQDDGGGQGVPVDCTFSYACVLDGHIFCHDERIHTP
jgi:hypothetical protein